MEYFEEEGNGNESEIEEESKKLEDWMLEMNNTQKEENALPTKDRIRVGLLGLLKNENIQNSGLSPETKNIAFCVMCGYGVFFDTREKLIGLCEEKNIDYELIFKECYKEVVRSDFTEKTGSDEDRLWSKREELLDFIVSEVFRKVLLKENYDTKRIIENLNNNFGYLFKLLQKVENKNVKEKELENKNKKDSDITYLKPESLEWEKLFFDVNFYIEKFKNELEKFDKELFDAPNLNLKEALYKRIVLEFNNGIKEANDCYEKLNIFSDYIKNISDIYQTLSNLAIEFKYNNDSQSWRELSVIASYKQYIKPAFVINDGLIDVNEETEKIVVNENIQGNLKEQLSLIKALLNQDYLYEKKIEALNILSFESYCGNIVQQISLKLEHKDLFFFIDSSNLDNKIKKALINNIQNDTFLEYIMLLKNPTTEIKEFALSKIKDTEIRDKAKIMLNFYNIMLNFYNIIDITNEDLEKITNEHFLLEIINSRANIHLKLDAVDKITKIDILKEIFENNDINLEIREGIMLNKTLSYEIRKDLAGDNLYYLSILNLET